MSTSILMRKKHRIIIYIICFTILSINTYFWQDAAEKGTHEYFDGNIGFWSARDRPCIDFFLEGKLYQGQLACAQGPITYGIAGLLKILFGDAVFSTGILLFLSLIVFMTFLLIFNITNYSLFGIFLFIIFMLPTYLLDFSSSLVAFFLISCLYFVYKPLPCTKLNYFLAGIFAALALFSKTTSIPILIALIPASITAYFLQDNNRHILLKSIFYFITGFIILSIVILVIYPNSIMYSFSSHVSNTPASIGHLVKELSKDVLSAGNGLNIIFVMLILLFLLIIAINDKRAFSLLLIMSAIVPLHLLIKSVDSANKIIRFQFFDYHSFAGILIFITGCFIFYEEQKSKKFFVLSLLLLLWAGYFVTIGDSAYFFVEQKSNIHLTNIFNDFLNSLDYSNALVDSKIARTIDKSIAKIYNENGAQPPKLWGVADENQEGSLKKLNVYNEEANKVLYDFHKNNYRKIMADEIQQLTTHNFSIVAISAWSESPIDRLIFGQPKKIFNYSCVIYTPLLLDWSFNIVKLVVFSQKDCDATSKKMHDFFLNRLDQLCLETGSTITEYTLSVLKNNGINYYFDCQQKDPDKRALNTHSLLIFLILFSCIVLVSVKSITNKKFVEKQISEKIMTIICIVAILISLLILYTLLVS